MSEYTTLLPVGYCTSYPFHVFLILANELCERFSFYGMKAVLIFFLWKGLNKEESVATSLYHTFVVFCYLTPLLGAMIADGWLGKYRTILYVSIVYACGNAFMTLSAIPFNGYYIEWLCYVALIVIAFGTGGIKPCVSSFGGDQFREDQVKQKDSFFSLFYLTINIGSLISTLLIPYIRGNIKCFGKECYSLCFGIPAILMVVSIVLFVIGTKWYLKNPPGSSILQKFFGCISTALVRKCSCSKPTDVEKKDHWIDYAAPDYDQSFIEDVKDVLRVSWLFIPVPIFWTLFDQMGSKWAFQAQQLNGEFEGITVYPDMMHFMNPVLVVVVVPLLEYLIYPCLDKIRIPNRPLQRMTVGMFLAGTAFLITGFLQMAIHSEKPVALQVHETKFQIINAYPGAVNVSYSSEDGKHKRDVFIRSLEAGGNYEYYDKGVFNFSVTFDDGRHEMQILNFDNMAYQVFITKDQKINYFKQTITEQTDKGESTARIFNGLDHITNVHLKPIKNTNVDDTKFINITPSTVSNSERLIYDDFDVTYDDSTALVGLAETVRSKNGGVYLLLLATNENGETELKQITEVEAWSKNIFLQTPQFIVITFGECLFSITGLSFAYSQAPPSMKSILTAIWLLTVCIGNIIIIIIVQGGSGLLSQVGEFFLFTGLMYATTFIFAVMSCMYTYVTPRQFNDLEVKPNHNDLGQENHALSLNELDSKSPSKGYELSSL